jgi:hypothetical protein
MLHTVTFFNLENGGSIFTRNAHNYQTTQYHTNPDDGGIIFGLYVGNDLPDYTSSHSSALNMEAESLFETSVTIRLHSITIFYPEDGGSMFI